MVTADTSPTARLKAPKDVLFKELSGEMVLLNLTTGAYFGLNAMGTRVWQLFQEKNSLQQVVLRLTEEFDVEETRCAADVRQWASTLCANGLLEPLAY